MTLHFKGIILAALLKVDHRGVKSVTRRLVRESRWK